MSDTVAVALIILSIAAVWCDLRRRRIPNALTLGGLLLALVLRTAAGLDALTAGLLGAALAFGLSLPLFAIGGLGGGDVKLLTAVGAFLGPKQLMLAMVVMALAGGVMALVTVVRHRAAKKTLLNMRMILSTGFAGGKKRRKGNLVLPTIGSPGALTIPYGVAIALGATAAAIAMLGGVS